MNKQINKSNSCIDIENLLMCVRLRFRCLDTAFTRIVQENVWNQKLDVYKYTYKTLHLIELTIRIRIRVKQFVSTFSICLVFHQFDLRNILLCKQVHNKTGHQAVPMLVLPQGSKLQLIFQLHLDYIRIIVTEYNKFII